MVVWELECWTGGRELGPPRSARQVAFATVAGYDGARA